MGTDDISSKATSLDEKIKVGNFEISRIEVWLPPTNLPLFPSLTA